jgi:hypothetical protein
MLQHTYRPGTAVLLWRKVGGSGWSSSCGYQLALVGTELVRGHVYIALGWGLWAGTGKFLCAVPTDVWGHNCQLELIDVFKIQGHFNWCTFTFFNLLRLVSYRKVCTFMVLLT